MNKDFLVILIEKDLRELELLAKGFSDLEKLPNPMIQLAKQKAENIVKNLNELEFLNLKLQEKPVAADESHNSDIAFLCDDKENQTQKPAPAPEFEHEMTGKDIPEVEEAVKEDPVDFMEDIKEFEIQEKTALQENTENETVEEPQNVVPEELPVVEDKNEETQEEPEKIATVRETIEPEKTEEPAAEQKPVFTLNDSVHRNDNMLGDVISGQKIDDIRNAINIGDRFRFQRELFSGNGEVMNKTIAYLNQLVKYEEAESFLNNKFGWSKDNNHAEDFLQIVRRRYI